MSSLIVLSAGASIGLAVAGLLIAARSPYLPSPVYSYHLGARLPVLWTTAAPRETRWGGQS